MYPDKDMLLATIEEVVQQWRNQESSNFAALADTLRQVDIPERMVGVIVLNLMTADKSASDAATIQALRNHHYIWDETAPSAAVRLPRTAMAPREAPQSDDAPIADDDSPWTKAYTRWNQRYLESTATSLGLEPTPEVERAVQAFRAIHSVGSGLALDLGAGDGRHTIYLAEQGFEVIAVDAAPAGIDRINQRLADAGLLAHTVVADLRDYTLPPAVDLLIASYVIHLLPNPPEFLRQWQEHTRTGGFCLVSSRGRLPHDMAEWWFPEPFELRHIFQYSGWHVVFHQEVEEYHPEHDQLFRRSAVIAQKRG